VSTGACLGAGSPKRPRPFGARAAAILLLVATTLAVAFLAREPDVGPAASGATTVEHRYALLQAQLAQSPQDERALVLKAVMDQDAQRFDLAAAGFEKALRERSRAARDPDLWVRYAEAVAMTQGQSLAGKPRMLLANALALAPRHALALELAGSAAWEQGEFRAAAAHWKELLSQLPADSARRKQVAEALAQAERRARVSLPPG
jgi:cytochrome c-type biogenesis protein CcmH